MWNKQISGFPQVKSFTDPWTAACDSVEIKFGFFTLSVPQNEHITSVYAPAVIMLPYQIFQWLLHQHIILFHGYMLVFILLCFLEFISTDNTSIYIAFCTWTNLFITVYFFVKRCIKRRYAWFVCQMLIGVPYYVNMGWNKLFIFCFLECQFSLSSCSSFSFLKKKRANKPISIHTQHSNKKVIFIHAHC